MNSISVIMLVCDREQFIERAISSVLSQSYKPKEIIIVDNGEVSSVDPSGLPGTVRYYKAIPYLGISQALNLGVSVSTGDYLCFLEDDDFWPEEYLEKIDRAINNSIQIYASDICYESGGELKLYKSPQTNPSLESVFIFNPGYNMSNICIERNALFLIHGFNLMFKTSSDKGAILEMLLKGNKVKRVDGNHVVSNISHSDKYSTKVRPLLESRIAFYRCYSRYFNFISKLKYIAYSARIVLSIYLQKRYGLKGR